jgi:glycosyltransferase involved in cell wall biosynthesis
VKVLFLTQVLPYPLDAGPKVRAYYVLRHLAARHAVTLLSFVRASDSPAALDHLREFCAQVVTVPMPRARWREAAAALRSLVRGEPILIARDWLPAMAAALTQLTAQTQFDIVHADQLWMAPYALAARAGSRGHAPRLVLDQHNAVYLIPRRLAESARSLPRRSVWGREAGLMARYEQRTNLAFDQVVTVTAPDQQALAALYPQPPRPRFSAVIPICIDARAVTPLPRPAEPGLLFLGGMHWPPNAEGVRWFARDAWPAIQAEHPTATFYAIGKQPPAELSGLPHVTAPGYVDDPDDFWRRSQVFVVPLLAGGGMRVKILDAWARGLPVVSTTIGAEGLDVRDGENLLLADTPANFARAINRVLADPALAARLAAAGRQTVLACYDWQAIYPAWEQVYQAAQETA